MKILNKKGSVDFTILYITTIFLFVFVVFARWRYMSNHNEISFWTILLKYSLGVAIGFISIFTVSFIIISIYDYIHSRKDWLKFYENKVSEKTIKSLVDEIDDYSLIKDKVLKIFNKDSDLYLFSYMLISDELDKIDDDERLEKEILEKFKKEIPLLLNKIKEIDYISFEENNYSVLERLSFQMSFININEDSSIFYEFDENIKEIINSRIMNNILESNSKEDIIAYTILYLFFGDVLF